jgi:hypothetical protein
MIMIVVDDGNTGIDSAPTFLHRVDEGSVPDVWEVPAGSIFVVQVGFDPSVCKITRIYNA